jgi:hypothetical protein
MRSRECWQQRRMDIDDLVRECLDEVRGQDPHESRKAHKADVVAPQHFDKLIAVPGPRRGGFRIYENGLDIGLISSIQDRSLAPV